MPKMKTHRGAAKRIKKTGSGKYKVAHANRNHILEKKTNKRKRHLRKSDILCAAEAKKIKVLLPYL
ncbi:50S ribosomal protein L35 [endosymbiont 'TC1' of Trimyema compressum]|uniref:50S ribosomal protein L35 n=1 Tax=endosymbiont 'TC1' of Trimyema compressum TaxID=243899 RepID=UPI0007F08250|nr:50S ribosomal protein L35 [endosymbiont 'TC1' of Trimyema compressum]AMP20415.1 50S ribosomal protein L35 [endosymbiont 'TC1' of Trimyema compressum]